MSTNNVHSTERVKLFDINSQMGFTENSFLESFRNTIPDTLVFFIWIGFNEVLKVYNPCPV